MDSRPEVSVTVPMGNLLDFIDTQLSQKPDACGWQIYNSMVELDIVQVAQIFDTSVDNLRNRLEVVKEQRLQILDSYLESTRAQLKTQRARLEPDETSIAIILQRYKSLKLAREIVTRIKFATAT